MSSVICFEAVSAQDNFFFLFLDFFLQRKSILFLIGLERANKIFWLKFSVFSLFIRNQYLFKDLKRLCSQMVFYSVFILFEEFYDEWKSQLNVSKHLLNTEIFPSWTSNSPQLVFKQEKTLFFRRNETRKTFNLDFLRGFLWLFIQSLVRIWFWE